MSRPTPDLEVLGRSVSTPAARPPRRAGRWTLGFLVLGLVGIGLSVLWPLLRPARTVRMVRVQPATGDLATASPVATGGMEDVGWLEAYPFPISVRPLVRGVLDSLNVLEGQTVVAGETVIGTLRNLDLETANERAASQVAVAEAVEAEARVAHAQALLIRTQRIDLRHAVADAAGAVRVAGMEVERLRRRHAAMQAAVDLAKVDVEAQRALGVAGSESPVATARAQARLSRADRDVAESLAAVGVAQATQARHAALLTLAQEVERAPRVLETEVARRAEALKTATAKRADAETAHELAGRHVEALRVVSPLGGVVMRLESAPGAVVGPEGEYRDGEEGGPGSTSRLNRMTGTLASLYDPEQMQLRVDVLFGRLGQIEDGGSVTFTVDAIAGKTFHGTVDRLVHEADINQNALQIKIRVKDPDPAMRPEMLCRVRFPGRVTPSAGDSASPEGAAGTSSSTVVFRVPSESVRDGNVYVFDPRRGGRARRVAVEVVGTAGQDALVRGELGLSTRVILDDVEDGERVEETS